MKKLLIIAIMLLLPVCANADLTLMINGLDTSMPVEIEPDDDIIIAVVEQTGEQKENYSVTCDMGGKLTPLPEPNSPTEKSKEGDYLFTFEDEQSGLAIVNLTVGDILDYQLILFGVSDANTVIFGINSDATEIPDIEGEPEPTNSGKEGDSSSQDAITDKNTPVTAEGPNDTNLLTSSYWQDKQAQRHLLYHPADSGDSADRPFANERFEEDLMFEPLAGDDNYQLLTGFDNVIDVSSDITSNTIWTADNTYHILCPIDVNSTMLVIEPGTTIYFAAGVNAGIRVLNGGTLISRGTPDEPIVFTSDAPSPWYSDYSYAVRVEETASTATQITYNVIEWAYSGIALFNIDLDTNIENNYLMVCEFGIVEYGIRHTDIINNLCFGSNYCGIYLSTASLCGIADANSYVLIQNNTCDYYQEYGIAIDGVNDCDYAGFVELKNNIVSGSYEYGLFVMDCVYITVANTGFYNNVANKNGGLPDYNSVEAAGNPYIEGPDGLDYCYLNQTCPFIDAGLHYVEETPLIGKTTDLADTPDSNKIDLGFHYPNWDYSNAGTTTLQADYDGNFKVDFKDFAILANGWKSIYDVNNLSQMADEWLSTISGHPAISISVDGDANNLNGEVGISVAGCSYSTSEVHIFMDGQLIGETIYESDDIPGITINTPSYINGSHFLKAVVSDFNGLVTLSENLAVDFNNPVYCLNIDDTYEPNQPFRILGINAAEGNSIVKLSKWWNGEIIWSQQTSGDLNVIIPGAVLAGQIYDVSVETDWECIWKRAITAKYNPDKSYKFAIFLPNAYSFLLNSANCRKDTVAGIVNGCEKMGIEYIILYKDQCTWENFSKVLKKSSVIYAYVVSRIGLYGTTSQRTSFKISDGIVASYLSPSEPLGGRWDGRSDVHSMASLGLGGTDQLKLVWIDVCRSGRGNFYGANDMAMAWMDLSDDIILNKLYVGWDYGITTSNDSCYGQWSAFFWGFPDPNNGFGVTAAKTYQQAFTQVQNTQEGGLDCVGAGILQNSIFGTIGDPSIRFSPNRYDYR